MLSRKRNLDAVRAKEDSEARKVEIAERMSRLRASGAYRPFPHVPAAASWLGLFKTDKLRYPILVVMGASMSGKTEFAKSLFRKCLQLKIGKLMTWPESLRSFDRQAHDGLVLDDVRDLEFLVEQQHVLQGKPDDVVEFATTAGGTRACTLDMYAVPIVATINFSTKNLGLLDSDDFLGSPGNRIIVHYPPPVVAVHDSLLWVHPSRVKHASQVGAVLVSVVLADTSFAACFRHAPESSSLPSLYCNSAAFFIRASCLSLASLFVSPPCSSSAWSLSSLPPPSPPQLPSPSSPPSSSPLPSPSSWSACNRSRHRCRGRHRRHRPLGPGPRHGACPGPGSPWWCWSYACAARPLPVRVWPESNGTLWIPYHPAPPPHPAPLAPLES